LTDGTLILYSIIDMSKANQKTWILTLFCLANFTISFNNEHSRHNMKIFKKVIEQEAGEVAGKK